MFKMRHFFEKKIAKFWEPCPHIPALLPIPTVLLQHILILSPISGDGTDRIHSRGRKNGCFWGCKILILLKAIQFYLKNLLEDVAVYLAPTALI